MSRSGYRLIFLTKPMAHHGLRAGYNVLTRYVRPDHLIRVNTTRAGRLANGLTRRLFKRVTGIEWYGVGGLLGEASAAWLSRRGGPAVVHVLYGEDLLWALPRLTDPTTKVVATFHQPPARFEDLVRQPDHLRRLNAIIALDPTNAAHLEWLHPGRVHTLSLGIDDDYWSPGPDPRQRRVLSVGSHLRDFDLLAEIIVACRHDDIAFDLVVPARRSASLRSLPNATVHSNISDDALRNLYRRARVFLLPLLGASANNAVLQALACGVPVVATDLPGVKSYVPTAAGLFADPKSIHGHRDAVLRFMDDANRAREARSAARIHVQTLSWRAVAEQHRALYARL